MTPTPAELIAAVRETLRPLGAGLRSAEDRAAFRRAMAVLRDGRWDEAAFDLLDENHRLTAALTHLGEAVDDRPETRTFAQAKASNHALRRQLADAIGALRGGDLSASATLRAELARLLLSDP